VSKFWRPGIGYFLVRSASGTHLGDRFLAFRRRTDRGDVFGRPGDDVRVDGLVRHAADQRLALELRDRSGHQQLTQQLVDAGVQFRLRHDIVDEPDPERFRGGEALGREKVAPRLACADGFDDVRRNGRRNEPELRF
jgi:hypothetical protein